MSKININDIINFYNKVIIPAAANANESPYSYMSHILKLTEMVKDGVIKLDRIIPEPQVEEEMLNITEIPSKMINPWYDDPYYENICVKEESELRDMCEDVPEELFNLSIDYFPKCGGYPQPDLSNIVIIQKFNDLGKTGDDSMLKLTYEDSLVAANAFDKLAEELMKEENTKEEK